MRPPKVDPKFARERIQPSRRTVSSNEPPKVLPKFAREELRPVQTSGNRPPPVQPKYATEAVSARTTRTASSTYQNEDILAQRPEQHLTHTEPKVGPDPILAMNPYEFEKLIIGILQRLGATVLHTQKAADNGLDGIVLGRDRKIGIQTKKYRGRVGGPEIQKFIGALVSNKLQMGVFFTSGRYTAKARQFAATAGIQLIDGEQVRQEIERPGSIFGSRYSFPSTFEE